jgi:hypothetical protein
MANQAGEYKNFTGTIVWGETIGQVKNACIELKTTSNQKTIVFRGGIWEDGICGHGVSLGVIWKNGTWKDGIWHNGTWENGNWLNGEWYDGDWKNGTWKNG